MSLLNDGAYRRDPADPILYFRYLGSFAKKGQSVHAIRDIKSHAQRRRYWDRYILFLCTTLSDRLIFIYSTGLSQERHWENTLTSSKTVVMNGLPNLRNVQILARLSTWRIGVRSSHSTLWDG